MGWRSWLTGLLAAWPGAIAAWRLEPLLPALASLLVLLGGALLVLRFSRGRRITGAPAGALGLMPQVLQMAGTLAVLGAATSLSNQAMRLLDASHGGTDAALYRLDVAVPDAESRAARYATLLAGLAADPAVEAASIGGSNKSPELNWTAGPSGTQSYAMVLHDLTNAPNGKPFVHWAMWNIPGATRTLPAGLETTAMPSVPPGSSQKSYSGNGYQGSGKCGNVYEFVLYALTTPSFTPSGTCTPSGFRTSSDHGPNATTTSRAWTGPSTLCTWASKRSPCGASYARSSCTVVMPRGRCRRCAARA